MKRGCESSKMAKFEAPGIKEDRVWKSENFGLE